MTNLVYHAPFFFNCRTNPAQHTCEVVLIVKSVKSTATIYTAQTVLLLKLTIQSCTAHPLLKYCYLWSCVWCITSTLWVVMSNTAHLLLKYCSLQSCVWCTTLHHCEWLHSSAVHLLLKYCSLQSCVWCTTAIHCEWLHSNAVHLLLKYCSLKSCVWCTTLIHCERLCPTQHIFYWSIVPCKAVSGVPHWHLVSGTVVKSSTAQLWLYVHVDTVSS